MRWQHPTARPARAPASSCRWPRTSGWPSRSAGSCSSRRSSSCRSWRARKPDMTLSLNISAPPAARPGSPDPARASRSAAGELDPARHLPRDVRERASAEDPDRAVGALQAAQGDRGADRDRRLRRRARCRCRGCASCRSTRSRSTRASSAGLGADPEDAAIVGALVELGHALGLDVIAEGVETDAQLEQLRELGCDAVQGYLIGPAGERGAARSAAGRRGRVATRTSAITPAA